MNRHEVPMLVRSLRIVATLAPVLLVVLAARPARAQDGTYQFTDAQKRNSVSFILDAPIETIQGQSHDVEGQVTIVKGVASGELRVPVASIKTGNALRDGHLRGARWLDADKHPQLIFRFTGLAVPSDLAAGAPTPVEAQGTFVIRGQSHAQPVKLKVIFLKESVHTRQRLPGDLLRVRGKVAVKLADYGIQRGDLALKVGEVAEVRFDMFGSSK
jgi:polyisoprenoid-binding protein YceI